MSYPEFNNIVSLVANKIDDFKTQFNVVPNELIVSLHTWNQISDGVAFIVEEVGVGKSFMGLRATVITEIPGDFLLVGLFV